MAVVRLREFERVQCGAVFSPEDRTMLPGQIAMLERFSERFRAKSGRQVFQNGPRRSLVAQSFVGVVKVGKHQVEVLPKIEGEVSQVQHNLASMVAATMGLTLYPDAQTQMRRVDETVFDVMIRLYCAELWNAIRQGTLRRYEIQEDNLVVLRGRLDVRQQLRHNLARPDRLRCIFDEFTADNTLNRIIKAALRVLMSVVQSDRTARSVAELLFCFDEISNIRLDNIDWTKAQTDRLSVNYSPLLQMSRLFIEGASPDLMAGKSDGYSLLFNMNELFERYIGLVAVKVFGSQGLLVNLQAPTMHLATAESGRPAFELRPDIVISGATGALLVIDTKWKRLKVDVARETVSPADMYQMLAYGHRYDHSEVIILYPHHAELGEHNGRRSTYLIDAPTRVPSGPPIRVAVATINLMDLRAVPRQLVSIAGFGAVSSKARCITDSLFAR